MTFLKYLSGLRTFLTQHAWSLLLLFVGVLVPFLLFGKLADEVHEDGGLSIDEPILRFIHQHASERRDYWIVLLTNWGNAASIPILVGVAFGLRWILRQRGAAVFFTIAVGGAWTLNLIAKAIFARERPSLWTHLVTETNYSFPSGHSMGSMAIAAALVAIAWPTRLRWPALLGALFCVPAIGFSRLYLGVHYPSDVLAGWSAALVWVTGIYFMFYRRLKTATMAARREGGEESNVNVPVGTTGAVS